MQPTANPSASSSVHSLADAAAKKAGARPRRFLSLAEVEATTRTKKTAIYAGMAAGTFPKNVRLPHCRSVAWLSTDIDAWMDKVLADNGRPVDGTEGQQQ